MSKTQNYTQCLLERQGTVGTHNYVAWIPSELAIKNRKVRIDADDCSEMWRVVETYGKKQAKEAETRSRDYLNQRKASDI